MKGFLITRASYEERWFEHIVTGFYVFIFLITIVTNTFLFTVFLRNKHFRDLSTYLIVQMAAADVLYLCITCCIIVIKNLDVQLSRASCKTLLYVEGSARFASSLSLMLISLERSTSVCSPTLCYSIRKVSGVKIKVFFSVAVTSLILRVGVLFVACDPEKWAPGYRLAVTVATYILPLVVELVAYSIAYHKINRRIRNSNHSKPVLLFIKKSLRVFVIIAVVFAVCTLPASILVILQSLRVYTPTFLIGYVGDMIECIPCVTNVICYVLCSPKFRMEIKKLFLGCNSQVEKATGSKSGEDAQDENGDQNQDKEGRAINKATLRLDWVLGDDPSQVAIPVSPPPRLDTPAFDIPSTVPEAPEFSLGTILEREEKHQARATSRQAMVGTWPRMRRLIYGACETPERNVSMESFISASTSNGLDSAVSKSSSEALDSSNISKSCKETVTQGTQTECSMVTAHEAEQKESSWL